jgi:hypothetical protein
VSHALAEELTRAGVLIGRPSASREVFDGPVPPRFLERDHLAAFELGDAPLPIAAAAFFRSLDPSVSPDERAALALSALEHAEREFEAQPSWPRALTAARIALSTGRFEIAERVLRFIVDLETIPAPREAFLPALPRYYDACLPAPRSPMERPLPSRWTVLDDDACAPPSLAEGRRRGELHPLLAVDPVSRWVTQQVCEALILFTPVEERRDALLQRFFQCGGRSLTLSLWRGITPRSRPAPSTSS